MARKPIKSPPTDEEEFHNFKSILDIVGIEGELKVTANYSFWRHPIKWVKEYKYRKQLGRILNYERAENRKMCVLKHLEQMLDGCKEIKESFK